MLEGLTWIECVKLYDKNKPECHPLNSISTEANNPRSRSSGWGVIGPHTTTATTILLLLLLLLLLLEHAFLLTGKDVSITIGHNLGWLRHDSGDKIELGLDGGLPVILQQTTSITRIRVKAPTHHRAINILWSQYQCMAISMVMLREKDSPGKKCLPLPFPRSNPSPKPKLNLPYQ